MRGPGARKLRTPEFRRGRDPGHSLIRIQLISIGSFKRNFQRWKIRMTHSGHQKPMLKFCEKINYFISLILAIFTQKIQNDNLHHWKAEKNLYQMV